MHRLFLKTLIALAMVMASVGCAATTSGPGKTGATPSAPSSPSAPASISVTIAPPSANIRAGGSLSFTTTVTGSSNPTVWWSVNGVPDGNTSVGIISPSGAYTAPASLPSPNTITITATSAASSSVSASSAVTLLNPTPTIESITPSNAGTGAFTVAIAGSGFVAGSRVLLSSAAIATTFISSRQLTATGTAPAAGSFPVTVENPDPGASVSNAVNLQVGSATQASSNCSQISLGPGASLNGFVPFAADNLWNQDVSSAAVDPNSAAIINFIGASVAVHPDFGAGQYAGSTIGIPYTAVGAGQSLVPINFTAYGDESDPGPMPIATTFPIEGYPNPGSGDRHVLVVDNSNCFLYELYSSYPQSNSWNADSAAIWDLLGDQQRPYTWTSADAAGLPIFPGLARYDEVAAGKISHALRFTLQQSRAAFVPPASHFAANSSNPLAAPMGMRVRLKASFDVSGFSATNQVILNALKKYGMIMADNGSSMYISGAPDDRWNNDDLHNLSQLQAQDFEVVQMTPLYTQSTVPTGASPQVTSFSSNVSSIASGSPVTLAWQVTGASYLIVSPQIGAVRGSSVSVSPTQTTTYTLYATNAFGRTTATVAVTVH
jgi:hypothetical protein